MTGRPVLLAKKRATRSGVATVDYDPVLLAVPGSTHDLIKRHLDYLAVHHYASTTVEKRRGMLLLWAQFCTERGVILVRDIARQHLERYQAGLYRARKVNGEPLSVRTQKQRLTVLRQFFTWAVKQRYVGANPAADIELPRPTHTLPVYLSADEVRRVLAAPDTTALLGVRDRAILECFYSTGIRRTEMTRLTVDDIESTAGLIRINQGKGHKDRLIPIGSRALEWIARYQSGPRSAWLQNPAIRFLFLQPDGYGMTPSQVAEMVRRCLRAADITKRGCCHLFRHTFATQLLNAGCDMRYIKDMLGHVSMDTTAHYAQVAVDRLKAMHATFHPAEGASASGSPSRAPLAPAGQA